MTLKSFEFPNKLTAKITLVLSVIAFFSCSRSIFKVSRSISTNFTLSPYCCKGKYVVENVIPYYEPLISAKKRGRHLYWTNFLLPTNVGNRKSVNWARTKDEITAWNDFHNYDFNKYKGTQRRDKIARNLVDYEAGKTIFDTARGIINNKDTKQTSIFDEL